MRYVIYAKLDGRTRYYKCYDGKKVTTSSKRIAPRFDEGTAGMIIRQLSCIAQDGWQMIGENESPK